MLSNNTKSTSEGRSLGDSVRAPEVKVAPTHDVEGSCFQRHDVQGVNLVEFAVDMWMKVGMLPRRSSSVWSLMAPLFLRKLAHGNMERHKSMVVASRA